MLSSDIPSLVPLPFAESGSKNVIPSAPSPTPGLASLTDGFPPLTSTPLAAGGIPPVREDFNGIFNLLSANTQWNNAGGFYPYNSAFSTSIGGYPKGAVLINAARTGLWLSTVDNNTVNPDSGPSANWMAFTTGRLLNVQIFTASGTYTPTAGTTSVIVEVQGGGGGGAGSIAAASAKSAMGGGGGSGAYGKGRFTSAFSGVTATIGPAGSAGAAGAGGGSGGTSSFGSLISAPGGVGGGAAATDFVPGLQGGGKGGAVATGGNILSSQGNDGGFGICIAASFGYGGSGGASVFGGGGNQAGGAGVSEAGKAAASKGSGGGGAFTAASGSAQVGGAGAPGIIIVYEYS